ncbi:HAMP domain-containing sensor histidine kinase [Massilia sp. YIM B04103]|uniref:sensor histidine kinase n=1 Tax=Massilia sp. YIM B04103 TaxID=2963106 RepID=UPI00210D2DA7|nr:HAMP domain-containing sensor histidine kinase [Massilia sp. YIM B04103]
MKAPKSLFQRLLGGLLLVMLAIWLVIVAMAIYDNTVVQARNTNAENKGLAKQILLNMVALSGKPDEMARAAEGIEELRRSTIKDMDRMPRPALLQVWQGEQRIHLSQYYLPSGVAVPQQNHGTLGDHWVSFSASDPATGITVRRDAMHDSRWLFTGAGASYYLAPLLYSLPFLILPAWIIVRRGLQPVSRIVNAIEERSASDLSPLPPSPYRELSPLVASVNSLMERLIARVERDKEFLTDAAHELKTPLSVIQLNAHLLLNQQDDLQRLQEADAGLRQGVARATHTVHQLLALERARSDQEDGAMLEMDLARFLRDRLAQAAPLAMQRGIEIELDAATPCPLLLHRESAASLLDNIIDNAIKYSPDKARVALSLQNDGQQIRLTISDQGAGIPASLRDKVFERFFRLPGQQQPGSGLGLAIARQAAARNGATITLTDGLQGQGLTVMVEFSALQPA